MTDDQIEKMIVDMECKVGTVYAVNVSKTILIEALKELQLYRQLELLKKSEEMI